MTKRRYEAVEAPINTIEAITYYRDIYGIVWAKVEDGIVWCKEYGYGLWDSGRGLEAIPTEAIL